MSFTKRIAEHLDGLEQYAGLIAESVGAIIDCPSCGESKVYAMCDESDRDAYSKMMQRRKKLDATTGEAKKAMQSALTNANLYCEYCGE